MIKDPVSLKEAQDSWETVRISQDLISRNLAAGSLGGGMVSHEFRNLSHNLTLLFAFSVLQEVLICLRDDGQFPSNKKDNRVGVLMGNSQGHLPWKNYDLVDIARDKRNDLAHDRKWIERVACWKYIDAIEEEFKGWGIIK